MNVEQEGVGRKTTHEFQYPNLFIGGSWIEAHSGRVINSIDPATEEVWATVAEADEVDVDRAVAAARDALDGPWSRLTATARGTAIRRLGDLIRARAEALAELETRDNGKPVRDTFGEISSAAEWLQFYAGAADKLNGDTIPYKPDALAYTLREPVGVVGAILPWNSPISLYSWKLGPALATGNTVVLKPAEQTPVTALELAKLIEEADFPAGVVNVIPGYGPTAGAAMARHPGIDKIAFTGEHTTAQEIMKACAVNLKRVTFECGGKGPHIIFDDANLHRAAKVVVHSAFRSTGQSCALGSRLFLHKSIYDEFLDAVTAMTREVRIGPPLEKTTHIGPHTSSTQLQKTLDYIKLGLEEGGELVLGGRRPERLERGYYVEPTVFSHVNNRSRLAQEEVFGPVLAVIPFETEDEVLRMANDVKYGLVAGIWTSDVSRAHRMAQRLKSGLVSVNTFRNIHWTLPYGGYKMSGLGRENGLAALHEFTELKTVVVDFSEAEPSSPFDE
jgi:aldehyde dehydrogenase (NAD+)